MAIWQGLLGREGGQGGPHNGCYLKEVETGTRLFSTIWTLTLVMKTLISTMMESHPPPPPPHPILYLPGLPDYGFYSAPSDQRGGPCSFADYGSLGPQAAQMLHSEHATSACNSPLQHLHSPDQFKNPGLYMSIYLIHLLEFSV